MLAAATAVVIPALLRADITYSGAQSITTDTTNPAGSTATWVDSHSPLDGNFVFSNSANYSNAGVFIAANDRAFTGTGTFINSGLFAKQGSNGVTTFSIPLVNSGNVNVASGTLSIHGNASGGGGYYVAGVAPGSFPITLEFNSNITGGLISNDGNVNFIGGSGAFTDISGTGSLNLSAGGGTFSANSVQQQFLRISNGAALVLGNTSTSTVTTLVSNSGRIFGSAADGTTVPVNATVLHVTGSSSVGNTTLKNGLVLDLEGAATSGANNIDGDSNALLNITSTGSLTNPFASTLYVSIPTNVDGLLAATGTGAINLFFSGTHHGMFNVSSGAGISAGGNFTPASVINDAGNFSLVGAYNSSTFNGTLNVASNATFTLGGTGPVSFGASAQYNFANGSTVTTGISPVANFTGAQNINFSNGLFTNGQLTFRNAALSFQNLTIGATGDPSTGLFQLETASAINIGTLDIRGMNIVTTTGADSGYNTVINVGTFNLSAGQIRGIVNVTGVMNWTGGAIDGAANGLGTYGIVTIQPGATLNYSGGILYRGGVLTNNGNLLAPSGFLVGSGSNLGTTEVLNIAGNSTASVTGILGAGNNGTLNSGSGSGVINVTGNGSLNVVGPVLLGSSTGGSGALNVSGNALVTVHGLQLNDVTITGGTVTATIDPNPPAGSDPEINGAIVGGYTRNGQLNINGGIVNAPLIKLGITSGNIGVFNQTAGITTVSDTFGIGNDASLTSGSGTGIASITGGTTNATNVLVGSSIGGVGNLTVGNTGVLNVSAALTVSAGSLLNVSSGGVVIVSNALGPFAGGIRAATPINAVLSLAGTANEVHPGGQVITQALALVGSSPSLQLDADNTKPGVLSLYDGASLSFIGGGTAVISSGGTGAILGSIDLQGSINHTITVSPGATLVIASQISNGGFSVAGGGTLSLTGAITGTASISGGTLLVSAGAVPSTVQFAGGMLAVRGNLASQSAGAIYNSSGTAAVIVNTNTTVQAINAGTFTVGSVNVVSNTTLTESGRGTLSVGLMNITYNASASAPCVIHVGNAVTIGRIFDSTGNTGIIKDQAGTLTLGGSNGGISSYGTMNVSIGTVVLAEPNNQVAIPHDLAIYAGTVQLALSNQISPTASITLNGATGASLLDLNGNTNTLGSLTFIAGGAMNTGSGVATLSGNVTSSGTGTAVMNGNLNLGSSTPTFNVAAGTAGVAMQINANISGGATAGLTKTGSGILKLTGKSTFAGPINISGGMLQVDGVISGPVTVNPGGQLDLDAGTAPGILLRTLNTLAMTTGATSDGQINVLPAANHSNRQLVVTLGVNFAGDTNAWHGQLDLANNDLVVQSGSLASITNQVKEGYNGGKWNGAAGMLSTSAAGDSTHLTALGVIQNNQGGTALYSNQKTFDGYAPAAADLLLKYTYYGDTNFDGKIDGSDYSRMDAADLADASNPAAMTGWYNGDLNYDGLINGSDYTLIDNAFNTQGATQANIIASPTVTIATEFVPQATDSVPEPTVIGYLAVICTAFLRRRPRVS